jgi:hypothetical protein
LLSECHIPDAANPADDDTWKSIIDDQPLLGPDQLIPDSVDVWHYIKKDASA